MQRRDGRCEVVVHRDGHAIPLFAVRSEDAALTVAQPSRHRKPSLLAAPPNIVWCRCPKCHQASGARLPINHSSSDYYECDACGHVWTVPKQGAPKP
jgi:predicted RNA-binding Zn-ribbon protein involved in translation (DUF1610 family)